MPTTYAVPNGRTVFAATTYTGDGATKPSSQTIVNTFNGVYFQPDFVWIKSRSNSYPNFLWDVIRGVTNDAYLVSNTTGAENSDSTGNQMSSFNSNGFSVQNTTGGSVGTNNSGSTFVGWQWKAGGTAVSNTSGSITSSVSANTTSGFSVVTYTGTGANATIGHGLGVAPSMIISKSRSNALDWDVYHSALGPNYWLRLNSTIAAVNNSAMWRNVSPTSTVWSIGTDTENNTNGATYVAYVFAQIAGFSAFGSYTGNGSADGPFVYLGFRPAFVMVKRTDSAQDWFIWDSSRIGYNMNNYLLFADSTQTEYTSTESQVDLLSNGFKIRAASPPSTGSNASGGTYIYMAFAENPFKYANAR